MKSNGYFVKKALPEHHVIFKPATKDGMDGRPKHGLFIVVPIFLKENVKEIPVESKRLQGVIVTVESFRILLINSYFPTMNMSDHCPIFYKFRLPVSIKERPTTKLNAKRYVPSWRNARNMEKESFSEELAKRLDHLKILPQSVYSQSVHCNKLWQMF